MTPPATPPRVLHVLKSLARGGIETWLMHVFANSDPARVRHELLLTTCDEIGPYEEEVRAAKVPIHRVPMASKAGWFADLYRFLRREGPFDVIHAHLAAIASGPAMAVAWAAGVPVRILHNHAALLQGEDWRNLRNIVREEIGTAFAAGFATRRIGISEMAIEQLAGRNWRRKSDCAVLLYGFDYSANRGAAARAAKLREALAIPSGATVIGNVGRFESQKNHAFQIDVFAAYATRDPSAVLILIGKGTLRAETEAKIARLGLSKQVRIVEGTGDVPAYMALFDVFLFPSFSEGLGIVILEAQAAGTPTLMTDNLPHEVVVVREAVDQLPLAAGAEAWAERLAMILARQEPAAEEWLQRVEASEFGMSRCVADLEAIYEEGLAEARI